MPGSTPELNLITADDGTDIEVFGVTDMTANLNALDAQFNATSGHDHSGAHLGKLISAASLQQPLALTAPVLTSPILNAATINSPTLAGGVFGAFTAWTPSITQGGTNPTSVNQSSTWQQIGKLVVASFCLQVTSAGITANDIIISTLPVAPKFASAYGVLGNFLVLNGGTFYTGAIIVVSASNVKFIVSGQANFLGSAPSIALANGDLISGKLTYEAA